jgi:hydroxyacylglutathione hydrolase
MKLLLVCLLAGCGANIQLLRPANPAIYKIEVDSSNAYVVRGQRTILVDTGWAKSTRALERALAQLRVAPGDLALIVLTHGHGDHAGGAARLRSLGSARIVAGAADVTMLQAGHNRPLHPMSTIGKLIRGFSDKPFTALTPDVPLSDRMPLQEFGIDGEIVPAPGHTPGSQMVILATGDALVGDLARGELTSGHTPARHFFHDDCRAAEAHLTTLVDRGIRRLLVGHGGPLDAARTRDRLKAKPCP